MTFLYWTRKWLLHCWWLCGWRSDPGMVKNWESL